MLDLVALTLVVLFLVGFSAVLAFFSFLLGGVVISSIRSLKSGSSFSETYEESFREQKGLEASAVMDEEDEEEWVFVED